MAPLISTGSIVFINSVISTNIVYMTNYVNTAIPVIGVFVAVIAILGIVRGTIEGVYIMVIEALKTSMK